MIESQGGSGPTEGGGGDGQSGQAASTALIEKILSEEPRWQGTSVFQHLTLRQKISFNSLCKCSKQTASLFFFVLIIVSFCVSVFHLLR